VTEPAVGVSLVPGGPAAVMTLAGGAVFGFVKGTFVISLASTLGAPLAFLLASAFLARFAAKAIRAAGVEAGERPTGNA
jgi:uncharacterized membrane protein YdjX (TVP38/TMEM64 family)